MRTGGQFPRRWKTMVCGESGGTLPRINLTVLGRSARRAIPVTDIAGGSVNTLNVSPPWRVKWLRLKLAKARRDELLMIAKLRSYRPPAAVQIFRQALHLCYFIQLILQIECTASGIVWSYGPVFPTILSLDVESEPDIDANTHRDAGAAG